MPTPVNCRYFYGDYFRGRNHEECRLLEESPNNSRPWRRKLCDSCPVPELLITSNCRDLALEADVKRSFLRERVVVTFAICTKHLAQLDDPLNCEQCRDEQSSSGGFG